ncbi:MAG: TIM barrel protein [Euryarchaeota archaeon]|nr:TIM barrel protein [Euryarchaeota archaeon]
MIFIGPAGVPLSCKGRTVMEGIQHVQELGLNAMEVEFVRGIRMDEAYATEAGRLARDLGVRLSVHSPYYTNLASDDEKTIQKSIDKITLSGKMADLMGADVVVCHPGFYTTLGKRESVKKAIKTTETIMQYFEEGKFQVKLGLEIMGKQQTFGDIQEVKEVCEAVPGTTPVIDFSHVHARSNGGLKTRDEFQRVFNAFESLNVKHWYSYVTGVKYVNGSELYHVPIKKGDMDVDNLVEVVLDNAYDITIISNSPIVEHDAMFVKIHFERALEKRGFAGGRGARPIVEG